MLTNDEDLNLLIESTNELVISLHSHTNKVNFASKREGLYQFNLSIPFLRTHFIASDLILGGDLIEAAVLTRKQMELLARLNELLLGEKSLSQLTGKTPNVKYLSSPLSESYGSYSQVSHSASIKTMQLLGIKVSAKSALTNLYPTYQKNAYMSYLTLSLTAIEYYLWCSKFFIRYFPDYEMDMAAYEDITNVIFEQIEKIREKNNGGISHS